MATQGTLDSVIAEITLWNQRRVAALAELATLPPNPTHQAGDYIRYPPATKRDEATDNALRCSRKLMLLGAALRSLAEAALYDGEPN